MVSEYLGSGVYVTFDGVSFRLEYPPANEILVGPAEVEALARYVKRTMDGRAGHVPARQALGDGTYDARCLCGWRSGLFEDGADAFRAAERHVYRESRS